MIMTAPLSAACASKCIPPSSAVAQLQNARTALASLESESGAKKFSDYIARAKDPLVLESIVAGLDLRVDGTRAASGRIPVRMDGRAFGKPFSTTFMLDLKDLEQSANRFFASRVVPAIKGRFGRKLVVPVKGRKAEAGSGAFLWGR